MKSIAIINFEAITEFYYFSNFSITGKLQNIQYLTPMKFIAAAITLFASLSV